MKVMIFGAALAVVAVTLTLTGCSGDAYSPNVQYGSRKDPIVRTAKDLGDERFDPDRPGLLPMMKMEDVFKPDHPYHAKLVTEETIRGAAVASAARRVATDDKDYEEKRKKLVEELLPAITKNPAGYARDFEVALDKVLRFPAQVPEKERKELEQLLLARFGTPAKPTVNVKDLDPSKQAAMDKAIVELKLDDETLEYGSTRYRVHCLHCHGVPGDGRGPTARWINPHPRDFRAGLFKFLSTDVAANRGSPRPPSRADLLRTLKRGIEGTAMPTFNLLDEKDLEALISYVIHLSLRGSAERSTILNAFQVNKGVLEWNKDEGTVEENIKFAFASDLQAWADSNQPSAVIKVAPYPYNENDPDYMKTILPASVKRGQQIFTAEFTNEFKTEIRTKVIADAKKKAGPKFDEKDAEPAIEGMISKLAGPKCVTCHVDYGRQARFRFDDWGTLVRPNNFPQGVFRGGRRPVDVYNRIHSGIPGSAMTPFGETFKDNENYIWDLVNFVSTLQYPAMREGFKLGID